MTVLPFRLQKGDLLTLDGTLYEWRAGNAQSATLHPLSSCECACFADASGDEGLLFRQ